MYLIRGRYCDRRDCLPTRPMCCERPCDDVFDSAIAVVVIDYAVVDGGDGGAATDWPD